MRFTQALGDYIDALMRHLPTKWAPDFLPVPLAELVYRFNLFMPQCVNGFYKRAGSSNGNDLYPHLIFSKLGAAAANNTTASGTRACS
jgi:hypothetical protein